MPLLKELSLVHRVRVVSRNEGLDSGIPGWEIGATISSIMHEQYLKNLKDNLLKGQKGTLLQAFSVGDWRVGYCSDAFPGRGVGGSRRQPEPREHYPNRFAQAGVG